MNLTPHIPSTPDTPNIPHEPAVVLPAPPVNVLKKERHVSFLRPLNHMLTRLSSGERLFLYVCSLLLAVTVFVLLATLNTRASISIPAFGGTLAEGVIGSPRFINPLLAISQADQDLSALVYSGLMRAEPEGTLAPDLAEEFSVSEDGKEYTFRLKPNLVFHDNTPITSEDIAYTVSLAQNADTKSPRRADWEGVTVATPDERTVIFTLPYAYAAFLESTQLGILPKHVWDGISSEELPFHTLNTRPVGSGPFRISHIESSADGIPAAYTLEAFDQFALGRPYLKRIVIKFYASEELLWEAFESKEIDSLALLSSERPVGDVAFITAPSTRVFGIFFNQNRAPVLADAAVREALSLAIDRAQLVRAVLGGQGDPLVSPIPGAFTTEHNPPTPEDRIEAARARLRESGWAFDETSETWTKKNQELTFTLSTADVAELRESAEQVAETWRHLGAQVSVQVYPLSEFNPSVLRPRAYDAVLFGEIIGRSLDLFAFWHSSQRNDPGLNLALYANTQADRLLAAARTEQNPKKRRELYDSFVETLSKDTPAIFLYSPRFVYVVPPKVYGIDLGMLTSASDRFVDVHTWYTDTERVWDVFVR